MRTAIPRLLFASVFVAACDSPSDPATPAAVERVTVQAGAIELTRRLDVRLDRPAAIEVDYWTADGPRLRTVVDDVRARHDVVVARLRAGRVYEYEVRAMGPAGPGAPAHGTFQTGALPPGFAVLEFVTSGEPTEALTLFELTAHGGGSRGVVVVDPDGEIVWYYEEGPVGGTARRANGNFIINDGGRGILEVAPDGSVVAERPQTAGQHARAHHDVIVSPAGTVLFIALDVREHDGRSIAGEGIWEWNPETGSVTQRWSSWDELSPDTDWGTFSNDGDWLHANAISLGPRGNVLMSLRSLEQVISIAPDFSHIEWRLGGINANVHPAGPAAFRLQHTASELPAVGGRPRVLLFDNGDHTRGFSRALELELDLSTGTAAHAWEFRADPDNFSFITSLARRMENGNTFVAFGAGPGVLGSFGPVEAMEVTPSGAVRFHIRITGPTVNDSFVLYRAAPLSDIAGEHTITSP